MPDINIFSVFRFMRRFPRISLLLIGGFIGLPALVDILQQQGRPALAKEIPGFVGGGVAVTITLSSVLKRLYGVPVGGTVMTFIVLVLTSVFAYANPNPATFLIAVVVTGLVGLGTARRSPAFRGWDAERLVGRRLKRLERNAPDEYRVINGLLLQDENHSTEIDHVVVSTGGVFVIETKSYRHLTIKDDGKHWYRASRAQDGREIRDPRKQNASHVAALKSVLPVQDIPFRPLVVLVRSFQYSDLPVGVVQARRLIPVIQSYEPARALSVDQVREIYETLQRLNRTDKAACREHIRRVQSKAGGKQKAPGFGASPW